MNTPNQIVDVLLPAAAPPAGARVLLGGVRLLLSRRSRCGSLS